MVLNDESEIIQKTADVTRFKMRLITCPNWGGGGKSVIGQAGSPVQTGTQEQSVTATLMHSVL